MWSHRINQIYPLVRLAIDKFPSDVVLDVLSGSIRSFPSSSDLFRLCTSNSVEASQWGTRDSGRKAAYMGWYHGWESLHGCLLEDESVWGEGRLSDVQRFCGEEARSDRHVREQRLIGILPDDDDDDIDGRRDSALACTTCVNEGQEEYPGRL